MPFIAKHFPEGARAVQPSENLQAALDKYGVVRLGEGRYPACIVRAGQHLRGMVGVSRVARITVEAGARDFSIMGLRTDEIVFPASTTLTHDGLIGLTYGNITGDGAALQNITFWANMESSMHFAGSRMTNCRWLHPQSHDGGSNSTRPINELTGQGSGNAFVALNALGPMNTAFSAANQQGFSVVGFDEETYRARKDGGPSLRLRTCPNAVLLGVGGYPHLSDGIDAQGCPGLVVGQSDQNIDSGRQRIIVRDRASTTIVRSPAFARTLGVADSQSYPDGMKVLANWIRPDSITPAPKYTGAVGDDTDALQRLLDAGKVVQLEPRAYGVRRSLRVRGGQSIVGVWGKTTLVAVGDIPILELTGQSRTSVAVDLYDLQLQGGSVGFHVGAPGVQLTGFAWSGVTWRGQSRAGVLLDNAFAIDNAAMNQCAFVDCGVGFLQQANKQGPYNESNPSLGYMDKMHAYQCLYSNCGTAFELHMTRADNLNSWLACSFINNRKAPVLDSGSNYATFAGCFFSGPGGEALHSDSPTTLVVRCFFQGAHDVRGLPTPGCEFL